MFNVLLLASQERTSPMVTPPKDAREATDTEEIWGELTAALVVSDWGAARGAQHAPPSARAHARTHVRTHSRTLGCGVGEPQPRTTGEI